MITTEEHIQQAYDEFERLEVPEIINQTFATFKTCLGEDRVDMVRTVLGRRNENFLKEVVHTATRCGGNPREDLLRVITDSFPMVDIIMWYPHETVVNENNDSTEVFDLFIRVQLMHNGKLCGNPRAKRSTFTDAQLYSGYIHSHIPSLTLSDSGIRKWKSMCFGYGPLSETLVALRAQEPSDARWMGFISEITQWTRIESLEGGPHFRMQYIQGSFEEVTHVGVNNTLPQAYIPYYIPLIRSYIRAKRLKLGFTNGRYVLGVSFAEWLVDFSNYAKAWESATNQQGLLPYENTIVRNNKIYALGGTRDAEKGRLIQSVLGQTVLTFKGQDIPLKLRVRDDEAQNQILIPYEDGVTIVKEILNIINTYGAENTSIHQANPTPIFWG